MRQLARLTLTLTTLQLLALSTATLASAQVCTDVRLTTQAEVDNFDCTSIAGYLYIGRGTSASTSNITNLDALSALNTVGDDLAIEHNDHLTDVDGLSGITSIGGNLDIQNNYTLKNLDGLFGVTSSVDSLTINFNNQLTNVDGISGITSVRRTLYISYNDELTNIDGLSGITSVGSQVRIHFNKKLENIDGLRSLNGPIPGSLDLIGNDVLTNVDGLAGVTSVGSATNTFTFLALLDNPLLTNLDGLYGLTSVGGDLVIQGNSTLDNFCGLFPLLDANGLAGNYTVDSNLTNPTENEIVRFSACLIHGVTYDRPAACGYDATVCVTPRRSWFWVQIDWVGLTPGAAITREYSLGGGWFVPPTQYCVDIDLGGPGGFEITAAASVNFASMPQTYQVTTLMHADNCGPTCECPAGFEPNPDFTGCVAMNVVAAQQLPQTYKVCNGDCTTPGDPGCFFDHDVYTNQGAQYPGGTVVTEDPGPDYWTASGSTPSRLNAVGVWACDADDVTPSTDPVEEWLGFSVCLDIATAGDYLLGAGSDNLLRMSVNGTEVFSKLDRSKTENFNYWWMRAISLEAGPNVVTLEGLNAGVIAAFGAEIAGPFPAGSLSSDVAMQNVWAGDPSKKIFSTFDIVGQDFHVGSDPSGVPTSGFSCPAGYVLAACGATPTCRAIERVDCQ